MKVLFAVSNDSISDAVIKRYPKEYRELLSYKNVYYFNAILKEIQNDKSYDRIVISEDLEPFVNSNHDAIDNFIFDHLDKISDEAQGIDGREISIILICSERRTFGTNILNKFFSIGIYNALIGNDRNMSELCKLINKPRTKKEAKIYYRIDNANYDPAGEHGEVSETEIQNILNHFKKLGKATDRYAESFDNIAAQYTDDQLRLIVSVLPMKVKAVLESESTKYQTLMGTDGASNNSKASSAASAAKDAGISINSIGKTTNMNGPVVIPSGVRRFTGSGVKSSVTSQNVNVQPKAATPSQPVEPPKPTQPILKQVEPVAEPVVEEPVVENPVISEPTIPEPVVPKVSVPEPVIPEPTVAEPTVESVVEPVAEPVVEKSVDSEPIVETQPVVTPKEPSKEKTQNKVSDAKIGDNLSIDDMPLDNIEPNDEMLPGFDDVIPDMPEPTLNDDLIPGLESEPEEADTAIPGLVDEPVANDTVIPGLEDEPVANDAVIPGLEDEPVANDAVIPGLEDEPVANDTVIPGLEDEPVANDTVIPGLEDEPVANDTVIPGLEDEPVANDAVIPGLEDEPVANDTVIPGLEDEPVTNDATIPGLETEETTVATTPNNTESVPASEPEGEEVDVTSLLAGLDDDPVAPDDSLLPGFDDMPVDNTEPDDSILPGFDDIIPDNPEPLMPDLDGPLPGMDTEIPGLNTTPEVEQPVTNPADNSVEPVLPIDDNMAGLDATIPGLDDSIPGTNDGLPGLDDGLPGLDERLDNIDNTDDLSIPGLNDTPQAEETSTDNTAIESIKPKVDYSMSSLNSLLTGDKKIVAFLGTTKNGTSFLVNNLALMFSMMGIDTAILDMTQNRNSYYLFTDSREELRKIAYTSISKLENGYADGIKFNKSLTVYTALPQDGNVYENAEAILSTLVQNHSLIFIDTDFTTPPGYFASAQEIYLVQSMDILTIQPLTAFLRDLKAKGAWEPEKARVVINKETSVKVLNNRMIIGGMSRYNGPDMSVMTDLFNKDMVKACSIPFDEKVYAKYLETMATCKLSFNSYPKTFVDKLKVLGEMVYPMLNSKKSYDPSASGVVSNNYNNAGSGFSNNTNNILNKMKKNF